MNTLPRLFHVIVIVARTGEVIRMTSAPVTHAEGCTILSKLSKYPWRAETLQEIEYGADATQSS